MDWMVIGYTLDAWHEYIFQHNAKSMKTLTDLSSQVINPVINITNKSSHKCNTHTVVVKKV